MDTMGIRIRKSAERGEADHGWLFARHTFSFAGYHDPDQMGFGPLRVMNEDRIAAGRGFDPHPHHDMEILTHVLSGSLEHKDSLGNGSVIGAGDFQRMSAGTGVVHSEFNPSDDEETHLYQIWIRPSEKGLGSGYEQKASSEFSRTDGLALIASPDGRDGSMTIQQDADIYHADLEDWQELTLELRGSGAWIQVLDGIISLDGESLSAGDGASIEEEASISLAAVESASLLVFDLPVTSEES